jgi:O-antigen/teichoic acid export membrane protein
MRNIFTNITGTAIAQLIPILVSPILTRIYSPQDYGVYGLFLSITALISVVATGRYEMAIMLPRSDDDVKSLINLTFRIMAIVLTFIVIIFFVFSYKLKNILGYELSKYFFLFPIFIFLTSITQLVNYLLIREKKFKELASNKVISVIGSSGVQLIVGGLFASPVGLIFGGVIGNLLACLVVLGKGYLIRYYKFYKMPVKAVAKEYRNFPIYDMPSSILNTVSLQLPIMAFSKFFDMAVTGYYAFVEKILFMPTNLISRSVFDVFKQKASEDYNKYGNCRIIFLKTLKFLSFSGLVPLVILLIGAPFLFSFIFGSEWAIAGKYAQILAPLVYVKFVASPLSYVFHITKKQRIDLCGQILYLIFSAISISIGVYYNNITFLLLMYTILVSCVYLVYLFFSFHYSKGVKYL